MTGVDDALDRIMALLCSEEVRLNGCACSPGSACYLHGVLVPKALARELPTIDSEELRFFHAAAVEYARAEAAEAEVRRLHTEIARQLTPLDVAITHVGIIRSKGDDYSADERDNVAAVVEAHTREARDALFAALSASPSDGGGA